MKPIRNIPIQERSVAGKIFSLKNNRLVSFESQLELAFIYHLEFSENVLYYTEQPFKVYHNNGKTKTYYIPDFVVYYKDFNQKPLLVEIKYSKEITEKANYVKRKISAFNSYAKENNFDFRLITERELLGYRLTNYKFLYGYITVPEHIIDFTEIKYSILNFVREKIKTTPQEIINTLGNSLEEKAKLLTVIWHLVANSVLITDLDKPLTNGSIISLNDKDKNKTGTGAIFFILDKI